MLVCASPGVLGMALSWKKPNTPRTAAPNNALEPTTNSFRSASAVGGGSPRALGVSTIE